MSSESSAVVVDGVTKTYRIGVGRARVREMTPPPIDGVFAHAFPNWWGKNCFDALEDVSVEIAAGSSAGIVGHNGAGKTTLLKLIAGVTAPTRGSITSRGRVAALLDVVVGFHPELTGRENLALLGGIYGFDRRAMLRRSDAILEFAEIHDMLDTPIKRYSAGMVARLGFATITAVEPDLLLIDEVLAVGDAAFQRKCIDWLDGYRRAGGALLFVSHNLGLIRNMTERVIWLDHGRLADSGPTAEMLPRYAQAMEKRDHAQPVAGRKQVRASLRKAGADRWGAGGARVDEVHVREPSDGVLELDVAFRSSGEGDSLLVGFLDESGRDVGAAVSPPIDGGGDGVKAVCEIDPVPLNEGIYFPVVAIVATDGTIRDRWVLDRAIVVDGHPALPLGSTFGPVRIGSSWAMPNDAVGEHGTMPPDEMPLDEAAGESR